MTDLIMPLTEIEKAALLNGLPVGSQTREFVRRAFYEIDMLRAELKEWQTAFDEQLVVHWIGTLDASKSPREIVAQLLGGALDQERDALRAERDGLQRNIEILKAFTDKELALAHAENARLRALASPVSPEADAMVEQERRWEEGRDER